MLNHNKIPPALAENTANLLFTLFIFIADVDDSISAREVQCLHDMIEKCDWCDNAVLRAGLEDLREHYADLWKQYQNKSLQRNLPQICARLDTLLAEIEDPETVLAAFLAFCKRLCLNSSPTLVRLGLMSMPEAKQKACRTAEAALSELRSAPRDRTGAAEASETLQITPIAVAEATRADLSLWPYATLAPTAENLWKRGRTSVRCVAVIPETHDVKSYVFQAVQPLLFAYKPGQFVTLELPVDGKTVRRSYTISSSPSRPHAISITVKRVPGGLVSNWLYDHMEVGFQFSLSGPHGDFSCFDAPAEKLLLISAGSGITPVMSMLRWLVDTSSNADIVFINNIRTPADVIFESELKYLGMRFGDRLKLGLIPSKIHAGQSWNGPACHFSEQVIKMWAPDYLERELFVCGPQGYMEVVHSTLTRMGFPEDHYHQESFGAAPAPPKVATQLAAPPANRNITPTIPVAAIPETADAQEVELVFSVSSKTVKATSSALILEIAEEHGIALESSCRSGNCGTCKVRKIEGQVEMDEQQALSEADIEEGFILACVGRACGSRVVIEA